MHLLQEAPPPRARCAGAGGWDGPEKGLRKDQALGMESPRALNTWGYLLGNPLGQGSCLSILVSPGRAGRSEPACGRWGWVEGGSRCGGRRQSFGERQTWVLVPRSSSPAV